MGSNGFSGPSEITPNLSSVGGLGSFGTQAAQFRTEVSNFQVDASPSFFIAVFNGARKAHYQVGGNRYQRTDHASGDIVLVPESADWIVDFDSVAESLCVFLPTQALEEASHPFVPFSKHVFDPLAQSTFRSPLVESLLRRLCSEATNGSTHGALYSDALISALVCELQVLALPKVEPEAGAKLPLEKRQLGELEAYVDSNIAKNITTKNLSDLLGLSCTQFSRQFKATTGVTPYQFVLDRRMERAKDLLERSDLTIAQVSYESGFSSQSHMTDVFKSRMGVSPGKMRGILLK